MSVFSKNNKTSSIPEWTSVGVGMRQSTGAEHGMYEWRSIKSLPPWFYWLNCPRTRCISSLIFLINVAISKTFHEKLIKNIYSKLHNNILILLYHYIFYITDNHKYTNQLFLLFQFRKPKNIIHNNNHV